jgi:hypothetical protein
MLCAPASSPRFRARASRYAARFADGTADEYGDIDLTAVHSRPAVGAGRPTNSGYGGAGVVDGTPAVTGKGRLDGGVARPG